ncbi:helix-turn-helix transcriptional regulator [Crocosphaera sp. UHCC 0190]|jgi:transcriptional regulator with XRE-family HTH domain|uniref:helix-turn-helix domain-containing protein n=1 Tax=Crocosphaera sp. UHCC 0190 TaxID=3110246 RepID=UPI002B201DCD|nr:helix-turn-helix transcriptional regulator [Crocosphaera sp. UHCC 0190]MEA5512096.1 helix-turn-helix transcriptional regulator [Crocosphaera sp. UHCC 0190]
MADHAFGKVLQRLRKSKGLSQEELSLLSGLDRTFISRLEGGQRQPTISTVIKLAEALNVSAASIVAEVEDLINENKSD